MALRKIRRITADWDFKNFFKMAFYLRRCFKLMNGSKDEHIVLKKSQSKGWHVIVWTRSIGKRTKLRAHIGDDKKRILLDKKRGSGKQTLFHKKVKW